MKKRIILVISTMIIGSCALWGCGGAEESDAVQEVTEAQSTKEKEDETSKEENEDTTEQDETEAAVDETPAADSAEVILPELSDSWYEIEEFFSTDKDSWTSSFVAIVTNNDPVHYYTWVGVEAKLLDKDGNELADSSETVYLLKPGQTQAVVGVLNCDDVEPVTVEISMKEYEKEPLTECPEGFYATDDFEFTDFNVSEQDYGNDIIESDITGNVKNLTDKSINSAEVQIIFYKDGKIVNGALTYASEIEPGATVSVNTGIFGRLDYDNYEVFINSGSLW